MLHILHPGILVDDAGFGQKAKRECAVMKGTAPLVEGLGQFPRCPAVWGINQISRRDFFRCAI